MAPKFSCPLLSKEEYEAVCVPLGSIEKSIHSVMAEYGFCVIPDVLSPSEVEATEALLTKDLIQLVDEDAMSRMSERSQDVFRMVKEHGVAKWPLESLGECYLSHGFLCKRGLAHSSFSWSCRFRARKIYEILHGTNDLVAGFDTIMATNGDELEAQQNNCWPHVDRSDSDPLVPGIENWEIYQSILYLWSSEDPRSSTTVVWPGSHKAEIYGRYKDDSASPRFVENGRHFSRLLDIRDAAARKDMYEGWLKNARRVTVPAGGLVIWSSKVTHQGWAGGPRLAQTICWEPRERRSEQARRRKMLLAALGLPSTHSASLGKPHGHRQRPAAVSGIEFRGDLSTVGFPLEASIPCYSLKDGVEPTSVWYELHVPDLYYDDDQIIPHESDLAALEKMLRAEVLEVM